MTDPAPTPGAADDGAAQALGRGLKVMPLSDEALQRVRAAVEAEWRVQQGVDVAGVSRRRLRWSLAASVLAAVMFATYWLIGQPPPGGAVFAQVIRAAPGDLPANTPLRVGEDYEFSRPAALALTDGTHLRVAAGTRFEIEALDRLSLARGEIYLDTSGAMAATLRIGTREGEYQHLGTQYALAVFASSTRLRVREGQVRWRSGQRSEIGTPGTQLSISTDGRITRQDITTFGDTWSWIDDLAPGFAIEGKPLSDFLNWTARELGRELDYADADVAARAAAITLHGTTRDLTVRAALAQVMSTTGLEYELSGGKIRVGLRSDARPPPR